MLVDGHVEHFRTGVRLRPPPDPNLTLRLNGVAMFELGTLAMIGLVSWGVVSLMTGSERRRGRRYWKTIADRYGGTWVDGSLRLIQEGVPMEVAFRAVGTNTTATHASARYPLPKGGPAFTVDQRGFDSDDNQHYPALQQRVEDSIAGRFESGLRIDSTRNEVSVVGLWYQPSPGQAEALLDLTAALASIDYWGQDYLRTIAGAEEEPPGHDEDGLPSLSARLTRYDATFELAPVVRISADDITEVVMSATTANLQGLAPRTFRLGSREPPNLLQHPDFYPLLEGLAGCELLIRRDKLVLRFASVEPREPLEDGLRLLATLRRGVGQPFR